MEVLKVKGGACVHCPIPLDTLGCRHMSSFGHVFASYKPYPKVKTFVISYFSMHVAIFHVLKTFSF